MEIEDRLNADGLIVREVQIRAAADTRGFHGVAVPWDTPIDLYGDGSWVEDFARGSVQDSENAKVFYQHREIIGHLAAAADTAAGWEVDGLIAETSTGNDAYALLRSGALDSLSVGFKPIEYRKNEDGSITYTKVLVREVSLVAFPAYTDAKVLQIRNDPPARKETPVDPNLITRAEFETQNDAIALLDRQFKAMPTITQAVELPEYRSIGEYVRAVVNGDEAALNLHRDYAGGTLADTVVKNSWIGTYIKFVAARRRIFEQFGQAALPDEGSNVEYAKLLTNTTKVGEQDKEGDNLADGGKITIDVATAPKKLDGAWAEFSFQELKNATVPVLDGTWTALLQKYAANTEKRVKTAYLNAITALLSSEAAGAHLTLAAGADADDYLDLIVDAAVAYETRGHVLTGANVSVDVFKKLLRLKDGGRRLMNVYGTGVNMVGEMNLPQVDGSLAGLRFSLLDATSTGQFSFYDPSAFVTLESPGAPIQLQDQNIINLTQQISLYGQTAVTNPFPDAILPVKIGE